MRQPAEAQPILKASIIEGAYFTSQPLKGQEGNVIGIDFTKLKTGTIAHELQHAKNCLIRTRYMIQYPEEFINTVIRSFDNDPIKSLRSRKISVIKDLTHFPNPFFTITSYPVNTSAVENMKITEAPIETLDFRLKNIVDESLKTIVHLYLKNPYKSFLELCNEESFNQSNIDLHKKLHEFEAKQGTLSSTQKELFQHRISFFSKAMQMGIVGYPGYAVPKNISFTEKERIYKKLMLTPMSNEEQRTAKKLIMRAFSMVHGSTNIENPKEKDFLYYTYCLEELEAFRQENVVEKKSLLDRTPELKRFITGLDSKIKAQAVDLWPENELQSLVTLPGGNDLLINSIFRRLRLGDSKIRRVMEQLALTDDTNQVIKLKDNIRQRAKIQIQLLEKQNKGMMIIPAKTIELRKGIYQNLINLVTESPAA